MRDTQEARRLERMMATLDPSTQLFALLARLRREAEQ